MKDDQARERIIEAATAFLRELGDPAKISVRDIAARAGVGVGLVNYHFQTKEKLVNLCIQRIISGIIDRFDSLYQSLQGTPLEILRQLVHQNAAFLSAYPGISWASITADLLHPGQGDNTSQTVAAYLPVVREVCAGRASETEVFLLTHTLISSLQLAFLRKKATADGAGLSFDNPSERDALADAVIESLFSRFG
jgi:AcrR family transcriptional regulator